MDLVSYVNGIHLANEAFEELTTYFAQTDEPVVLAMYRDHMPGFSEEARELMGLGGTDPETQRRCYSIPVLIWSSFKADKIEPDGENINYLPQILLEYAGLPDTDMSRVLKQQRESIQHFMVMDYDILFGSGASRERVWLPYTVKD